MAATPQARCHVDTGENPGYVPGRFLLPRSSRFLHTILRFQKFFAFLAVLLFIANSLVIAGHLTEEVQDALHQVAASQPGSTALLPEHPATTHHHNHGEPDSHHKTPSGGDCCSHHGAHSHDLTGLPTPALLPSPLVSVATFFEQDTYPADVFIDRFIPPQNLA